MAKKVAKTHQNSSMSVCVEKFVAYATRRGITLDTATYGFYMVSRNGTKKLLGAVRAVDKNGVPGWVINWADKQRKFIADSDKTVAVGKKKYTPVECSKYRHPKPADRPVDNGDI